MNPFDPALWFPDAVRYFRAFGFFAAFPGSDDQLGNVIQAHWRGDWPEYLAAVTQRPAADQLLLVADTQRVWWCDLEGVYPGAQYYATTLNEWAAISRDRFNPHHIQEAWHGDHGPVEVTFALDGIPYTFVHRGGDFLDHGLLPVINRALAPTSFRYEVGTDFGDSNWIVVLNPTEKKRLASERGWRFLG